MHTLIVLAKQPVPGRVKTRLVPPFTHPEAAALAAAALADTLAVIDSTPAHRRVLAFDGDPTGWLRPGWQLARQPAGGLDARLVAAFAGAGPAPALLVGMDTPQVRPEQLYWNSGDYDACLGPCTDGGYWAIGLADPRLAAAAITGVPMSSASTGAWQLRRLRSLGLRVQRLDELRDVDTAEDAWIAAAAAPGTRFARALRRARTAVS